MQNTHRELTPTDLISAAVTNVFENWEAFKIGTSMSKQSKDVAKWVIDVTTKCLFDNSDVDDGVELGEWIGDILDHEFNLVVEDGSLNDIGNQIIEYWKMYQNQQFLELADILDKRIAEAPVVTLPPQIEPGSSSSDDDSGDEDMDTETSSPQPGPSNAGQQQSTTSLASNSNSGPDADGWITVTKNKRR